MRSAIAAAPCGSCWHFLPRSGADDEDGGRPLGAIALPLVPRLGRGWLNTFMARLRARWNQSGRQRSYRDVASVLSMNIWKLAGESLLNLENEGFAIHTYRQRLDIILEFVAYSLHIVDRLAYMNLKEENRRQLVVALAAKLMAILFDNSRDLGGKEKNSDRFAAVLDKRGEAYADCGFGDESGPSFTLRRLLGEYVQEHIADTAEDRDRQWLPDYVLEREAPAVYRGICKTLDGLLAD